MLHGCCFFYVFFYIVLNAFICLWMVRKYAVLLSFNHGWWIHAKNIYNVSMCANVHHSRPIYDSLWGVKRCLSLYVCVDDCSEDEGGRKRGQSSLLSLSTVLRISAAHHYIKVSINHSLSCFIVSPSNVWRLLNKKTFLYGEEGRGKKRGKKFNCIHWTLKCFDGFWEPHYIYIGMCH